MVFNDKAVALVKVSEAFRPTRYWDVHQWAIGYGTKANHLPPATVWTERDAHDALVEKFEELTREIRPFLKREPTKNQSGAMLSLAYNIGVTSFLRSSVLRKFNEGDIQGAADSFLLWKKARVGPVDTVGHKTLVVLKGLLIRRKAERKLFLEE